MSLFPSFFFKNKTICWGALLSGLILVSSPIVQADPDQTIGGGTIANPAVGPDVAYGIGGPGFVLVKNWKFGSNGTIKNIDDLNHNFQYHDQFGTFCCGNNYGALIVAPDATQRINASQPIDDPQHPIREFFDDSMKTYLIALNGADTVDASSHSAGSGSFQAQWKLPKGGSFLGQDVVWQTRVRYNPPRYFWFAIWAAGNIWINGAEMDLVETFGYDNGGGSTNFKGNYFHSNSVGGTDSKPFSDWPQTMGSVGITKFNPTEYHTWTWVYKKDNTYEAYVDQTLVQSGKLIWTVGGKPDAAPLDMDFIFDGTWGNDKVPSVNHTMPASELQGKFYEWDYSRVYLR